MFFSGANHKPVSTTGRCLPDGDWDQGTGSDDYSLLAWGQLAKVSFGQSPGRGGPETDVLITELTIVFCVMAKAFCRIPRVPWAPSYHLHPVSKCSFCFNQGLYDTSLMFEAPPIESPNCPCAVQ